MWPDMEASHLVLAGTGWICGSEWKKLYVCSMMRFDRVSLGNDLENTKIKLMMEGRGQSLYHPATDSNEVASAEYNRFCRFRTLSSKRSVDVHACLKIARYEGWTCSNIVLSGVLQSLLILNFLNRMIMYYKSAIAAGLATTALA